MNRTALERHRSLYTTLLVGTATVAGLCFLVLMRMPDASLVTRLGLGAAVVAVNIFFALMMNVFPRLDSSEKTPRHRRKPLVPHIPDPDGLRWRTA